MTKFKTFIFCFIIYLTFLNNAMVNAQAVPAVEENIPYLVTFGADAETSWGDDDFCQVYFFLIPETHTEPVYIRVYDPEIGGMNDEQKGEYNTTVNFSVYGGFECWSNEDAQNIDPIGKFDSGNLLNSKNFDNDHKYDNDWYTFGPFNPFEGEMIEKFGGRVFKVIVTGKSGDDGNLYRFFLSTNAQENKEVEGGNIFTYEYTFRLSNDMNDISQIYPFADDRTISVEVTNFDWDNDGYIRINSIAKNGMLCDLSTENQWIRNKFPISEREQNSSLEIQFIKRRNALVKNNNVVISIKNQYGEALPFFSIPIGGVPVYTPKIRMKAIGKKKN
ncbi:hypothetical protein BZG02_19780 [Labilibaculum filiforme]|uniref:Uncharacterized protein n=1 Tax=Labilibaculum filiforme TaxID=1940526 RepID=A0A2N3HQM7_9BACT|nr:hypothetical protein [Labilibaculum filiforme]PKQ60352.1 hypothetical protein BZG02_19780 [Labilibaculum filiforme]